MPLSKSSPASNPDPAYFAQRVAELRRQLAGANPARLAALTATVYVPHEPGKGEFQLSLWGRPLSLSFPDYIARDRQTGDEEPLPVQALLLYYFDTADGAPETGRWVSFAELPNGRFYNQAFQGYTGQKLARTFAEGGGSLAQAAASLGERYTSATEPPIGDAAFFFRALPRLPLLLVYWQGDEDFPPSTQILFDNSASHYLPTDVCAILGSMLTAKLIAARPKTA